ncbi:MAG: hypothetical protein JWO38_1249 [Gemmataceae bacterium]|nr:hypothetical protein [Gemmataceae bacterium]
MAKGVEQRVGSLEDEISRLKELLILDPKRALASEGAATVEEACAFLTLCRQEVQNMMDAGLIASVKHGKRRLILKRSLVDYLASLIPTN